MLKLSSFFCCLSPGWLLPCALILGLSPAVHECLAQEPIQLTSGESAEDEEEESEKLIGLLDPALAKPLMTLEEEKDFQLKRQSDYTRSALKSLSPTNADEQLIEEGVRYRVLRMTIPENWAGMANMTGDLIKDIEIFAASAPRAREHALETAVKELDALIFSDQPTVVKINAALLLGNLNIENASRVEGTPAVPYREAAQPLIKILTDPKQRMDVKIPAVGGLTRIMMDGDPPRAMRDRISKALTDELNGVENYVSGPGRDWYQWRLITALGTIEFPRTMTQQTYVVDALWKVMHNEELPWHLRTRAVRSLGQLKLDASFNIHLLVHEIVLLTGQMTAVYNSQPGLSFWPLCFSDVYFAFRPEEERQQKRGWGLLQNPPGGARQIVQGAYEQILPLVNAVLKYEKPQKVDINLFNNALKWMKDNPPPNAKIHQNAKPLMADKPKPAPADNTGPETNNSDQSENAPVPAGQ